MQIQREYLNFILQSALLDELENLAQKIQTHFTLEILQNPTQQTLMLPVKDPISGGEFYAGEVLVTTSLVALQDKDSVNTKAQGFAMVLDDNPKHSLYIAIIDAYYGLSLESNLQDSITQEIQALVVKTQEKIKQAQILKNHEVDKTRVNFELM